MNKDSRIRRELSLQGGSLSTLEETPRLNDDDEADVEDDDNDDGDDNGDNGDGDDDDGDDDTQGRRASSEATTRLPWRGTTTT